MISASYIGCTINSFYYIVLGGLSFQCEYLCPVTVNVSIFLSIFLYVSYLVYIFIVLFFRFVLTLVFLTYVLYLIYFKPLEALACFSWRWRAEYPSSAHHLRLLHDASWILVWRPQPPRGLPWVMARWAWQPEGGDAVDFLTSINMWGLPASRGVASHTGNTGRPS